MVNNVCLSRLRTTVVIIVKLPQITDTGNQLLHVLILPATTQLTPLRVFRMSTTDGCQHFRKLSELDRQFPEILRDRPTIIEVLRKVLMPACHKNTLTPL